MEELRNENGQLRELFRDLSEGIGPGPFFCVLLTDDFTGLTAESKRQHDSILEAVRATAQEQVPFNISGVGLCQTNRDARAYPLLVLGRIQQDSI